MRSMNIGASILGAFAATALVFVAASDATAAQPHPYSGIPTDQAEFVVEPSYIQSVVVSGAPTLIWQTLEHSEKTECLACIPLVANLLYDNNAKNREIAAWWLRRRMLGVYGPGQVYQQTLNTLAQDASATRRGYAASALGEFLEGAGIAPLATALTTDTDPGVRAAAASALGRINDDGQGALGKAFGDVDPGVRLAAVAAAGRINSFVDTVDAAKLLGDSSALVRRRAVMLLDEMNATDSVAAVLALAQTDSDSEVRLSACHALGTFGNSQVVPALTTIATSDANAQVRDQAHIATLRL
jgi:HEAT repeat protein